MEAIAQEKNILVRQMSEETMQLQMNIRSLQEHVRGIEHEKQTLIIRMKEESQSYTKQVGTLKEQLQLH